MACWRLFYHIVWATKGRSHLITAELELNLHSYLRGKIVALGGIVHAMGGIEDHVHVAASIPPKVAVATFVGQLKGASSHWVNHLIDCEDALYWQDGYGVLGIASGGGLCAESAAASCRWRFMDGFGAN